MQEHSNINKDQKDDSRVRTSPIHIVPSTRQPGANAEALRDVHMSLVRAEQNLYNLVQASHANGQAGFHYGPAAGFATGYAAPAFPPGFAPSTAITPTAYGFAPQPNGNGVPTGFAPSGFAPLAYTPGQVAYSQPAIGFGQPASTATWNPLAGAWNPLATVTALPGAIVAGLSALSGALAASIAALPGATPQHASGAYATPAWAQTRVPACDISDEGKSFVCNVDLPGLRADQVDLLCLEQAIIVSALREVDSETMSLVQAERGVATPQRTIVLPAPIQPSATKATLNNGILTVTLPKVDPTEGPRRIKVQG